MTTLDPGADRAALHPLRPHSCLQPMEVLRPGMKREFVVAEDEDEYGEIILSLAAIEMG